MKRLPLVANFILSTVLCASLAYWGIAFFKPRSRPVAPPAQQLGAPVARIEAAAGLFGGRPDGALAAGDFQLKGVIAAGPNGVAILSASGKPPQVVGVGMEAASGVTVDAVYATYVLLNEGGMIQRLDLPENAKGGLATGALALASPSGAPVPAPAMNVDHGQMPSQPAPVMMVNNGQMPGLQQSAMNINNGGNPGQQSSAMDYYNHHLPNQHPLVRRPGGIGPAAWGAKPTGMSGGG